MSVFFNGRLVVSPATMSVVDDSAMYNQNPNVGNILAVVGKADGGKPFTALRFGSAAQARAVLRGGDSLRAIEKAFDPSSQTMGPSEVVFIRVNPATQSALVLKDASGVDCINLISQGFGRFTGNVRVKIESGSLKGKKLSTQFGNDYYTVDNLVRNAISLSYTGSSVIATVSVSDSEVSLTTDTGIVLIDLTDYSTIGSLADRINAELGFSATVLDGNTEKSALLALDTVVANDLKVSALTLTGNLQACIDWMNSAGEGFVTATRASGAQALPANLPYTYLTGGSDGITTMTEWQQAFDALQKEDVQWLVAVSPNPAIHAMASSHVDYMSNIARLERRAIVGMDVNTADADAIAAAKLLNSDRISLTHIGYYDYNDKGILTLYPAYILAGLLGGMVSGVNPGTPLTNKSIKVRGLELLLSN